MSKTSFLSFGLVSIHITFHVFFFYCRLLYNNEITHLPENVFSGLSALQHL